MALFEKKNKPNGKGKVESEAPEIDVPEIDVKDGKATVRTKEGVEEEKKLAEGTFK